MTPCVAADPPHPNRRVWPTTALLVILAVLLTLYQGFGVAITTAPFFGDQPSRDSYILAGMAALTTLPVFAAMAWCGWQRGSRLGLWLIGAPAALLVLSGLSLLGTNGDSRDPHPTRALSQADLFGDMTWLNWGTSLLFAGVAVATHLQRRRARHTELALPA